MLFVISGMFKAPFTMLTLVLVQVDRGLVSRVDPVGHGGLQDVGQMWVGTRLGDEGGGNAA